MEESQKGNVDRSTSQTQTQNETPQCRNQFLLQILETPLCSPFAELCVAMVTDYKQTLCSLILQAVVTLVYLPLCFLVTYMWTG